MKLSKSVAELQREHVVMELECIDRMYLNAYVPQLTTEAGVASFVRGYLGHRFASTKAVAQMTESFVESIMQFALDHRIDVVRFKKGQRKDDVMQGRLRAFKKKQHQGVVFIGVAQEKACVPRTVRKAFGDGGTIPWIHYSSANVNFYYFYCVDEDFGPFFIKFCSYFPYTAKLCINGHEYLKCQLDRRGIDYEALDNGISWCEQVAPAQRICDHFGEQKTEAFFRKWLRRLPHPFSARDRGQVTATIYPCPKSHTQVDKTLNCPATVRMGKPVVSISVTPSRPIRPSRRAPDRFVCSTSSRICSAVQRTLCLGC
jgi:hypothetical protein